MCKIYILYIFFGFIEALDLERILNRVRIDFRYVTNKIVLKLLITFSGAVRKMFRTRVIFG